MTEVPPPRRSASDQVLYLDDIKNNLSAWMSGWRDDAPLTTIVNTSWDQLIECLRISRKWLHDSAKVAADVDEEVWAMGESNLDLSYFASDLCKRLRKDAQEIQSSFQEKDGSKGLTQKLIDLRSFDYIPDGTFIQPSISGLNPLARSRRTYAGDVLKDRKMLKRQAIGLKAIVELIEALHALLIRICTTWADRYGRPW